MNLLEAFKQLDEINDLVEAKHKLNKQPAGTKADKKND
jgi:hypothetical protein